jgi:hypothetical protein
MRATLGAAGNMKALTFWNGRCQPLADLPRPNVAGRTAVASDTGADTKPGIVARDDKT